MSSCDSWDDHDTSGQAVFALSKRPNPRAREALEEKLTDDRPWVRKKAAIGLPKIEASTDRPTDRPELVGAETPLATAASVDPVPQSEASTEAAVTNDRSCRVRRHRRRL
jgi:HEAT repeat protein